MSRETEKVLKEIQKFLALHEDGITDEESLSRVANQFLEEYNGHYPKRENTAPETADDYLELAEQATSKKKCLEYLRKAVELEPEHVDAQLQLIAHTLEDKPDKQLPALRKLLETAAKPLEQEGYFQEDVGDFWTILETRPYMRVRQAYLDALISCGKGRDTGG